MLENMSEQFPHNNLGQSIWTVMAHSCPLFYNMPNLSMKIELSHFYYQSSNIYNLTLQEVLPVSEEPPSKEISYLLPIHLQIISTVYAAQCAYVSLAIKRESLTIDWEYSVFHCLITCRESI